MDVVNFLHSQIHLMILKVNDRSSTGKFFDGIGTSVYFSEA